MELIFSVTRDTLVVEMFGDLDHYSAEAVRQRIDDALDSHNTNNLIFDFSKVDFMDSSGIGMILGRYRQLCPARGKVAICGCSQHIRSLLNMAGLFSIIDYYDTQKEAVEYFGGKEVS